MQESQPNRLDRLLVVGLIGLIVWPPLAMGGVAPWARSAVFVWIVALLAVWLVREARAGALAFNRHPVWLFVAAFLGLAAFQLVPLSADILKPLQSATVEAHARAAGATTAGETHPISLSPYDTRMALLRVGALALVFFLVLQVVRTRGRMIAVTVALLAVCLFEALYGMAETFSGQRHIFALPHPYPGEAVTGTFLNKNHFAGLLESVAPLGLALAFALGAARYAARSSGSGPRRWGLRLAAMTASPHFAFRIVVGAVTVVLVVAVLLSLSRAGTLALLLAFAALAVFALRTLGLRRGALVTLTFLVVVVGSGAFVGLSRVSEGLEDAASGHAASWEDRLDLSQSGLRYAADFPLFGSGLGTFGSVFPIYQSSRFGDRRADYLHNDWLQLGCETGAFGAALFVAGLAVFLWTVLRNLRRRNNPFSRWMTVGALAGVLAMLVHSAFDYNLSRITANGIVFVTLLGLAYRASVLRADDSVDASVAPRFVLPLGFAPARWAVAGLAPLLLVGAVAVSLAPARADLAFNRYQAAAGPDARAEDYFFLDTVTPAVFADVLGRDACLDRAAAFDPDNPRIAYACGLRAMARAEAVTRERARATARLLVGAPEGRGPSGSGTFETLAETLARSLRSELRDERRPYLEDAAACFRRSVALAPTFAAAHAELGAVQEELEPGSQGADAAVGHALALAPNRPAVLFIAGVHALGRGDRDRARVCFRRAIRGAPTYAERVFAVARSTGADAKTLFALTPETRLGYANLTIAFWQDSDWPNVMRCLDALERFVADDPRARLELTRRRVVVQTVSGQEDGLDATRFEYRRRLRNALAPELARADFLRRRGRGPEAMAKLLAILDRDSTWADVRIRAAELATLPRVAAHFPAGNGPLDHLLRLGRTLPAAGPETDAVIERARRVLTLEAPRDAAHANRVALAAALLDLGAGRMDRGSNALRRLASIDPSPEVLHHVARVAELQGRFPEACEAYRAVVAGAPRHLDALRALVRLGEVRYAARADALTPPVSLGADFGGLGIVLGYGIARVDGANGSGWELTLHWRSDEVPSGSLRAVVHFLDAAWGKLFVAGHPLPSEATIHDDAPQPGEVTVIRIPLPEDPRRAAILRFGVVRSARSGAENRWVSPCRGKRFAVSRAVFRGVPAAAAEGSGRP